VGTVPALALAHHDIDELVGHDNHLADDLAVEVRLHLRVRLGQPLQLITVRPESDIRLAARLMHEQKLGALPVVDQGRVVGILTERDVIKTFVQVLGEGILSKPERWGLEH